MRFAIVLLLVSSPVLARADVGVLHVASNKGIAETTPELVSKRVITKTPARWPRYVANRTGILFLDGKFQLKRVDLAPGAPNERVVAKLPAKFKTCKAFGDIGKNQVVPITSLAVQEANDFEVSADGKRATLSLKDRNVNMVSIDISFDFDLTKGTFAQEMVLPECPSKPGAIDAMLQNMIRPGKPVVPPDSDFIATHDLESGWIVRFNSGGEKRKVAQLGDDFVVHAGTPPGERAGRWLLIRGNESEGDMFHADAYLLDREQGAVYPIVPGKARTTTPKAIQQKTVKTVDTVGESTIEWLSPMLLQIDQLLIVPGVNVKAIPGELAR